MNNRYDHLYLFKEDGMYKMKAGTYEVITEDYSTLFSTQPAKMLRWPSIILARCMDKSKYS